jgi:hypothetical protein
MRMWQKYEYMVHESAIYIYVCVSRRRGGVSETRARVGGHPVKFQPCSALEAAN